MTGAFSLHRISLLFALLLLASGTGSVWGQVERPDGAEPIEAAVEGGLETAVGGDVDLHRDDAHGHDDPHAADTHGDAAHGDEHGIDFNKPPLPGLAPDLLTLFLYSLVLFGIFLLLARMLVWTPLIQAFDQRETRVNRALAEAEAARTEAARLLAAHESKMGEARDKVSTIVAQARREAEQQKAQIIAEAEAQARRLKEEAIADIHRARDEANAQLEQSIDAQVALATEHIVGHPIA